MFTLTGAVQLDDAHAMLTHPDDAVQLFDAHGGADADGPVLCIGGTQAHVMLTHPDDAAQLLDAHGGADADGEGPAAVGAAGNGGPVLVVRVLRARAVTLIYYTSYKILKAY